MSEHAPPAKKPKIFDKCPHCGEELSPWEKVLLSVDRALMCRHCWYRIIVDIDEKEQHSERSTGKGTEA